LLTALRALPSNSGNEAGATIMNPHIPEGFSLGFADWNAFPIVNNATPPRDPNDDEDEDEEEEEDEDRSKEPPVVREPDED
jgi:hypothetical protein